MAFGSFFKKIAKGVKNIVSKAAPIVSKVAKTVAPMIGGSVGNVLNTVGNIADKADKWANGDKQAIQQEQPPPQYTRNPRRFDIPMMK